MLFSPSTLLLLLVSHSSLVNADSAQKGESCNPGNNKLQQGTYQFTSDCDSVTYCDSSTNTCQLKKCRRDAFPYGYDDPHSWPDLCPDGQFCPDEEDQCQAQLAVGSACQLNRDDECAPPPNANELRDRNWFGLNYNGSVCLNYQCMWANVTLGETCVVENTAYIAYTATGEYVDIVSRDNCKVGLYCDGTALTCIQTKSLGATCDADKECSTYNCMANGKCGKSAFESNKLDAWVYVVVGICIFGGMFGTLFGLFFIHSKQRNQEREKRLQYWREQNAFRQNIMQMRDTAQASILSLPENRSPRSTVYSNAASEDSQVPMLQGAGKSSGLRHAYSDEGTDENDSITMHMRHEGKF